MKKRLISIILFSAIMAFIATSVTAKAAKINKNSTAIEQQEKETQEEKPQNEKQQEEERQEEARTKEPDITRNRSLHIAPSKAVYQEIVSTIIDEIDPSGTGYYRNLIVKEQAEAEILSCERDRQGFTLTLLKEDTDENEKPYQYKETVSFHIVEELPEVKTQEEMRDFFLNQHPDATEYSVFPLEDDNKEKKDFFYWIEENDITYGYFTYWGQTYEIRDEGGKSGHKCIDFIKDRQGYDYRIKCAWEKNEDGDFWDNHIDSIFWAKYDIGTGEKFYFYLAPPADNVPAGEAQFPTFQYEELSVYRENNSEPFQKILIESDSFMGLYGDKKVISFEDFNADGYSDIFILRYYGANGGTAFHYLWSPTKEQFIKSPDELDYFGSYWIDEDTRRLYMHHHASAISGTEFIYQWENETDCSLIKKFERDYAEDESGSVICCKVMDYPGGKERMLLDYNADYEEEETFSFAWDFYYDDFLWDKEISDPASGEVYHLYYAVRPNYGDDGDKETERSEEKTEGVENAEDVERSPDGYTECLYVIDSSLQPVNYLKWESKTVTTEISYIEQGTGVEGMLELQYANGHKEQFSFSDIIDKKN